MSTTFSLAEGAPGGEALNSLISMGKYGLRAFLNPVLLILCVREYLKRGSVRGLPIFLPLLAFCGWSILSTAWSPLKVVSLGQSGSLLVMALLSVTFAVRCDRPQHVECVLKFLCTSLLVIGAGLILLKAAVPSLTIAERETTGLFHALNVTATASLGLVLTASCAVFWRYRWAVRMLFTAVPVHGLLLFLSVSRLGVALTAVVLVLILIRHVPPLYAIVVGLLVCSAGILLLGLDPGLSLFRESSKVVSSYALRGQSASDLSALSGREEMWTVMLESWRQSPLIGHGYFVSSATGEIEAWHDEGNFTAHNVYIQALVSTGIIGLALFVWGIFQMFIVATVKNALQPQNRPLAKLLCVLALWYLAWGLMNDSILGPVQPETVVLYTVLGLALGQAFPHAAVRPQPVTPSFNVGVA